MSFLCMSICSDRLSFYLIRLQVSRLTSYSVAVQRILRGVGVLSHADARGHTQQVLVLVRSTVVQPYRVY